MTKVLAAILIAFLALAPVSTSRADDDDLDRDLLGDLESDLLKDLNDKPDQAKPPAKDQNSENKESVTDSAAKPANPLSRVLQQMRDVESLIAKADASKKTQDLQVRVISQLDELIQQLQKQASKRNKSGQSASRPQGGQSAAERGSDKPASESSNRLDRAKDKRIDALAPQQLVKEVWGHLPPRVVEQMTRSTVEKFLPKYEQLIEDYFRRLAEEPMR